MVALHTTIDPSAPLLDGFDMLTAASAEASRMIPVAPSYARTGGIRQATGFRRAPVVAGQRSATGVHRRTPQSRPGATRFWRTNDISGAFRANATNVLNRNRTSRAMALLSSAGARGPQTGPWGVQIQAPRADYLQILNSRAQADAMFRRDMARNVANTLTARFNLDRLDPVDGHLDVQRTITAKARGFAPMQLRYA